MYYGGGGYDFYTVYEMPVWLRKFTYQKILETKQREADAISNKSTSSKDGHQQIDLANPDRSALPDYAKKPSSTTFNTRASKK